MHSDGSIRAFIALPVPEEVRHALAMVQRELCDTLANIAWTREEAIHLTLHFLGRIHLADLPELKDALQGTAGRAPALSLEAFGLGHFGGRVLWAGVRGDTPELMQLAAAIRKATAHFGDNREDRAFNAHLTLGRSKTGSRRIRFALGRTAERFFGRWQARHVVLYQSELSFEGARHTELFVAPLKV